MKPNEMEKLRFAAKKKEREKEKNELVWHDIYVLSVERSIFDLHATLCKCDEIFRWCCCCCSTKCLYTYLILEKHGKPAVIALSDSWNAESKWEREKQKIYSNVVKFLASCITPVEPFFSPFHQHS